MTTRQPTRGYMKFDPTITTDNLLTLGTAVVSITAAFFILDGRASTNAERTQAQYVELKGQLTSQETTLKELRMELKDLQKSINQIDSNTAFVRGRLASDPGTPRKQ